MTQNTQLTRNPLGSDLPYVNYSTTLTIAAKAAVVVDTTAANLRGVTGIVTGGGGSAASFLGVCATSMAPGRPGLIQLFGEAVMVASGAVAAGDRVIVDVASGKEGRAKTRTSGQYSIGICITGGADGDDILIALTGTSVNA